jgi:hypothetical protein
MTWAIQKKCDSAGQKLVLLMLANHCNGYTGQCNPSHKLLADECSMGVSTLKRQIASLEEAGFLAIVHKSVEGVSLPNQYMLKLEGVDPIRAGGGSNLGGGAGPNRATDQEDKPGSEPKKNKHASQCVLPGSFTPDDTARDIATSLGLNAGDELTAFADHHAAKGSTFICWQAAFRTWLRNAAKFSRKPADMTANRQALSFAERDELARHKRYREMTGRDWPTDSADVIDITPTNKRIES